MMPVQYEGVNIEHKNVKDNVGVYSSFNIVYNSNPSQLSLKLSSNSPSICSALTLSP